MEIVLKSPANPVKWLIWGTWRTKDKSKENGMEFQNESMYLKSPHLRKGQSVSTGYAVSNKKIQQKLTQIGTKV